MHPPPRPRHRPTIQLGDQKSNHNPRNPSTARMTHNPHNPIAIWNPIAIPAQFMHETAGEYRTRTGHPCQAMTADHSRAVHHAITGSHYKESHTYKYHSRALHHSITGSAYLSYSTSPQRRPPSSHPCTHPIRHSPHPH